MRKILLVFLAVLYSCTHGGGHHGHAANSPVIIYPNAREGVVDQTGQRQASFALAQGTQPMNEIAGGCGCGKKPK